MKYSSIYHTFKSDVTEECTSQRRYINQCLHVSHHAAIHCFVTAGLRVVCVMAVNIFDAKELCVVGLCLCDSCATVATVSFRRCSCEPNLVNVEQLTRNLVSNVCSYAL